MILLEMHLATNKVVGSMINNPKQQEANQSVIHERDRGDRIIDLVSRVGLESCISRLRVRRAHHLISTMLPLYSGTNTSVVNIRSFQHGIFLSLLLLLFFFSTRGGRHLCLAVHLNTVPRSRAPNQYPIPCSFPLRRMLTYNFVVISCTSILFNFYDLGRKTEKERRATSQGGGRSGKSI